MEAFMICYSSVQARVILGFLRYKFALQAYSGALEKTRCPQYLRLFLL